MYSPDDAKDKENTSFGGASELMILFQNADSTAAATNTTTTTTTTSHTSNSATTATPTHDNENTNFEFQRQNTWRSSSSSQPRDPSREEKEKDDYFLAEMETPHRTNAHPKKELDATAYSETTSLLFSPHDTSPTTSTSHTTPLQSLFSPPPPVSQAQPQPPQAQASATHPYQSYTVPLKAYNNNNVIDNNDDFNHNDKMYTYPTTIIHPPPSSSPKYSLLPCSISIPSKATLTSTLIGSMTVLFYHIVFALAMSSAIARPTPDVFQSSSSSSTQSSSPLLCPITKMAALSSILVGPMLTSQFHQQLPSLYPCLDLFLAPFLAQLATIVEDSLRDAIMNNNNNHDHWSSHMSIQSQKDYNMMFLNTFAILSGMGMILSGILCFLGSQFKIANIGNFLPHAVLCGFFSSVGIMIWSLAFSVDNNGLVLSDVTLDNSLSTLFHHIPSFVMGCIMWWIGAKSPVFILQMIGASIAVVYCIMGLTGTTLEQAQDMGWFWTGADFEYNNAAMDVNDDVVAPVIGFFRWAAPPAPMGVLYSLFRGNFDGKAVQKALPTVFAMAFIFAIRCSLHATALKQNKPSILAIIENRKKTLQSSSNNVTTVTVPLGGGNSIQEEDEVDSTNSYEDHHEEEEDINHELEQYKNHRVDVLKILMWYGNTQIFSGIMGGFACLPSLSASHTLTKLGAEKATPQYCGAIFLIFFYLTNFKLVQYIPKMAFSCLLILCFLDLMNVWFIKSYQMTKEKYEWMVAPLIVLSSFSVGMLASVALGVAISTFIFVASFYKTGVVKFIDTGLVVRSTIERSALDANWLDQNGDLIQVMVLQNYLFFGNSSSCLNYISTMFEEVTVPDDSDIDLPPIPKYLIIDFSLCSGMDTSAVSVFAEVISLCKPNECKTIFAGLSQNLKEMMKCGGILQSQGKNKSLSFSADLESALGVAEDGLLTNILHWRAREIARANKRKQSRAQKNCEGDGFLYALRQIDEQHGTEFEQTLQELSKYTIVIELKNEEQLFERRNGVGIISESDRGLFFIEHGLMRVERDPSYTMSRSSHSMNNLSKYSSSGWMSNGNSIGHYNARTHTIGKQTSYLKSQISNRSRQSHTFRLARIGPGWIIGAIESCAGLRNPGIYTAVTSCRLHHLPHSVVEEIEEKNPALILNLFKMLSHLMARRQDVTIGQLATLHSIIANPPLKKPMSRFTMGALQRANAIAS